MDLYFQGLAWLNKGFTPKVSRRRAAFSIARLPLDPDNVEALVGSAAADDDRGRKFSLRPIRCGFRGGRSKVDQGACRSVPDHAHGHLWLGLVEMFTKRAARGHRRMRVCAWRWIEISPTPHAVIGFGKILIGRAEETEAHIPEALRLSPRDSLAYVWLALAGVAKLHLAVLSRRLRGVDGRSRPTETIRDAYSCVGRRPCAAWSTRRGAIRGQGRSRAQSDLHYLPRPRPSTAMSDDPTYLAQLERMFDGLRKTGVPEQ